MSFKKRMEQILAGHEADYNICGVISTKSKIYPIGSDTKVLSTIFELFSRPLIQQFADENGYELIESDKQNVYPDFTLQKNSQDQEKIAVDVKTTYRQKNGKFKFTLGGYASFMRIRTKNIVAPFDHYKEHWILGYVYDRVAVKKSAEYRVYEANEIKEISLPYANVESFLQEKWKVSGDKAGSGNTTNIGSITGTLEDFIEGKGVFSSEEEFLDYWRNYEKTDTLRYEKFKDIHSYREWKEKSSR